jgi:hypothetical protein
VPPRRTRADEGEMDRPNGGTEPVPDLTRIHTQGSVPAGVEKLQGLGLDGPDAHQAAALLEEVVAYLEKRLAATDLA